MARLSTIFVSNKDDILKISFKSTNNFVADIAGKRLSISKDTCFICNIERIRKFVLVICSLKYACVSLLLS